MPTLTIDGVEITVEAGSTVMQACVQAGKEIPHFCYHDRLSIAGNCRMCLVEMEKSPKPIASCAMPAGDGMAIRTDTPSVRKAREGVMEFLLINHPLDCPICDQGGECDLQDQAMAYGRHFSRFDEGKRAVRDKDIGPLIETIMTRCVHCTRCIRFADEIAGVEELGAVFRGEHMEIGTYVEKTVGSELSGNMIDLCPVGALTSKPYAFVARSWELRTVETIDVLDAVGSNVRADSRGPEVLRVVPRLHEDVNEEWLSDKSRFAYDGLRRRRLDRCYVRRDGRLEAAGWTEAFDAIAEAADGLDGSAIGAVVGDLADCESMTALADLMVALGSPNLDCRQDSATLDPGCRASYLFNTTIAGIEEADAILLIGTNPRWEAALVNARIRKRWRRGGLDVGAVGPHVGLTYPCIPIGAGPLSLMDLAAGKHDFADSLGAAERPMMVVGMGALARPDGAAVLAAARALAEATGMIADDWNGFNVLHTAAARVGGLDLGLVPGEGGRDTRAICEGAESGTIRFLYLLGADELPLDRPQDCFVVYQGHHGDAGARIADVVLPGAAWTEKPGTYVNLEGRPQRAYPATAPLGEAREDWRILRALSGHLGEPLACDTLEELRARMAARAPWLSGIDRIERAPWGAFGARGAVDDRPFASPVVDFYRTDPVTRASETMARCSAAFVADAGKTGTDG